MASELKSLTLPALLVLASACSQSSVRYPLDQAPLWVDDDRRPFETKCTPDPEEPGHALCAPEAYVSPFAWDGADNMVFRPISEFFEVKPGTEASNVNSFDEIPDSSWFENRIGRKAMTPEELVDGPCGKQVLDPSNFGRSWLIDQGKPNGANPGFRVRVEGVGKFMLKSDIKEQPERATAAAAIATRLYWAFGYFAACDSVVYFSPELLRLKPGLMVTDNSGIARRFDQVQLDKLLDHASHRGKLVRMSSSRWLPGRAIGPFRYEGVREDDPNDVVPHEDRRELRGARLLAAWLNHFDSREQNSMNTWMAENQEDPDSTPGHIQHWYIDLGDCFGSEWDLDGISRRLGHAYYLDFGYLFADLVTFGVIERPWDRARRNPDALLFGYYSERDFDAEAWRAGYPNPAFSRMTEADGAWAARIIARMSPDHVAAAVRAGDFTSPRHTQLLTQILLNRQNVLLRRYLSVLSPLSDVELSGHRLCAKDLARRSPAFRNQPFAYSARLRTGGSLAERQAPALSATADGSVCLELPRIASSSAARDSIERYFVLDLFNGNAPAPLRVHLYDLSADGFQVAGLERPSDP
jgi:hypothetical protein